MEGIKTFIGGILGGLMISIGSMVYLNCDNKIAGAVLFSFGLISIMTLGMKLYTGVVGYVRNKRELLFCVITLLGNVFGTLFSFWMNNERASLIFSGKLDVPLGIVLLKSIACGIIIYAIVDIYKKTSRWEAALVGVPVFILGGAEHSIADMCFMVAAHDFSPKSFLFILLVIIGNAIGSKIIDVLERCKKM